MEFTCPKCGWSLEGGDYLGVQIYPPEETFGEDGNYPPEVEEQMRFNFCFHCGEKVPEPDSLEKLREIICQCANDAPYKSVLEDELLKAVDVVTALIERGA